jgi:hypothetical protein
MAKKDEIFNSFMEHELLKTKYELKSEDIPKNVREAKNSQSPIVKLIAEIVDTIDGIDTEKKTDQQAYDILTRYLSTIDL